VEGLILTRQLVFTEVSNQTPTKYEYETDVQTTTLWPSAVVISNTNTTCFYITGCAIAQAVSHWLSTTSARVRSRVCSSGICGGQSDTNAGFLRVLGFPCQSSFHQILHHNHLGHATIGQSVAAMPSGPPLSELKN
jgi:hypothetical protein